jgi:hypothetical protein
LKKVPLEDIRINLSIGTSIEVNEEMIEILGFKPEAKEIENFESSFKEAFSNEVKAVELLPHDVRRFKQPVEVKFEAVSEENVVYIQKVDPK